jgi:predicted phosphodiesterase
MIYITGDTHGSIDIHKLTTAAFKEQKNLTKDDYLIICGDCGIVWANDGEDRFWQKWLEDKPFTTLFVDGNHENHDLLNSYPVEEWHGGRVHFIQPSVIHLMRGQIFDIDGKSFFTMGGAQSTDKQFRKAGVSWWAGEVPTFEEQFAAFDVLKEHGNKVDYIITHTAPKQIIQSFFGYTNADPTAVFLDEIYSRTDFQKWYFGHFHENRDFGKLECLYDKITLISDIS